jgi:5-methylcytosine-specific restriction protein A
MRSFLVTFKPKSENSKRGWPLENLQVLVSRLRSSGTVQEDWRFASHKKVALGDRAFLLVQGKLGPAIIGYGRVSGTPKNDLGYWQTPITFETLVDPSTETLVGKDDVLAIKRGRRYWRTENSGIELPDDIANNLEAFIAGKAPKGLTEEQLSNPDWTRDELIVALNVYLKHRPNPPGKDSSEIADFSRTLRRLGEKLFPPKERSSTFRNENGVYMKLMNFRRLDPEYTSEGKKGLARGAKAEEEVWKEFASNPVRCQQVSDAIVESLDDPAVQAAWVERDFDEDLQEAEEGRLLTRQHLTRERNRKLVEAKRKQIMKKYGKLICEVCDFDFSVRYGDRGQGFIECHHTKPVVTLSAGYKTHIDDLALVCANCHRIIHRRKPWLTIAEMKAQIKRL